MDSNAGDWQGILPYDESERVGRRVGAVGRLLAQLSHWRQV